MCMSFRYPMKTPLPGLAIHCFMLFQNSTSFCWGHVYIGTIAIFYNLAILCIWISILHQNLATQLMFPPSINQLITKLICHLCVWGGGGVRGLLKSYWVSFNNSLFEKKVLLEWDHNNNISKWGVDKIWRTYINW